MDIYEVAGWLGAVMVVGGYLLVTRSGPSRIYHGLNLGGASGLLVNALHHGAIPSSALNALWALIAVWGIRHSASGRPTAGRR